MMNANAEFGPIHNKVGAGQNLENFPLEDAAHMVTHLAIENDNTVSHEDGLEKHIHPNIHQDMELLQRVPKYDQHAAEVLFPPVLSKKQEKKLKKAQILGKPMYRTRSMGDTSPTAQ